ncbi:unnamed protein product [Didymodactylos carnosus]|uniref:Uncharacterized protein n=1 Tax=Didymodactylos carnosus TaxID=1234261 RepID=A0A815EWJ8_9BILA|nr:unnamed protein product [Didymodactylos carnosus]CAF1315730.1 unnamed protein product [Didymodactylos carnosus]CAF3846287.1 unnamed protein product [Didymodactylos carnosus]CAF4157505.1 unnamed protein product [Didymodactylos carnosus]
MMSYVVGRKDLVKKHNQQFELAKTSVNGFKQIRSKYRERRNIRLSWEPDNLGQQLLRNLKIQPQRAEVVTDCGELQEQCAHVANDCDKLEQQRECAIKSVSVQTDIEDAFARSVVLSLTADDTLINTVVPQDVLSCHFENDIEIHSYKNNPMLY